MSFAVSLLQSYSTGKTARPKGEKLKYQGPRYIVPAGVKALYLTLCRKTVTKTLEHTLKKHYQSQLYHKITVLN